MRKLLLGMIAATLATAARANPMLEKCLPFAPQSCALTRDSAPDDYLTCFENVKLKAKVSKERACSSELLHARVHKACDQADIPTLCADVKPGGNRTMSCLKRNFAKLTKPCRDAYGDYLDLEEGERKKGKGHSGVSAVRC